MGGRLKMAGTEKAVFMKEEKQAKKAFNEISKAAKIHLLAHQAFSEMLWRNR